MKIKKFWKNFGKIEKDSIPIGIDYVLTQENKPYLLEINLGPGGLKEEDVGKSQLGDSEQNVFINACLPKDHQHQVFGNLMPDFTTDKAQFGLFSKEKKRVVYKKANGSRGEGVSVIEKPTWGPDLIEEFIKPKTVREGGKNYPFVLRDLIYLNVRGRDIQWRLEKTFRKKNKTALEDGESLNEQYKINIMNRGAERTDASPEEIEVTNNLTQKVVEKLIETGEGCSWKPMKIFDKALIVYYAGYRITGFAQFEFLQEIKGHLKKEDVDLAISYETGDLENRTKYISSGSDALILTNHHNYKQGWYDSRIGFDIEKDALGNIVERATSDNSITRKFLSLKNVFVEEEKPAEEVAQHILKIYRQNRLT